MTPFDGSHVLLDRVNLRVICFVRGESVILYFDRRRDAKTRAFEAVNPPAPEKTSIATGRFGFWLVCIALLLQSVGFIEKRLVHLSGPEQKYFPGDVGELP
jgi:hypothetical protein